MVAPIISNEHVIGVFDLESDRIDSYSPDDLAILQMLTSQVAIIIEKVRLLEEVVEKKRIEAQLEVARQVQLELLPDHDPQLENFEISAYIFPTEEVSGDYYDWVEIFDDQIGITVADAVGKGMPAALLMSFLTRLAQGGRSDRICAAYRPSKGQQPVVGLGRGTSVHYGHLRLFSIRQTGLLFFRTPVTIRRF